MSIAKIKSEKRIILPAVGYLTRPEIHQEVTKWRSKEVTWDKIAERLSKRLSVNITGNSVRKGWKVANERIPANMKNSLKNYIFDMENYMLIGRWYSIKLMPWSEMAKRFSKRIGKEISARHLETSWHEASNTDGFPKFERITLADYIKIPENFAKIMKWRNKDSMTWENISIILGKMVNRKLSHESVRKRYNEAEDLGLVGICNSIEKITNNDVFKKIVALRFDEMKPWSRIQDLLLQEGIEVSIDVLKNEIPSRFRQVMEQERLKKKNGIFLIDDVEMSYKDIVNNNEIHEEIKMWINYAGYTWNDISERLGRRYGCEFVTRRMKDAYIP